eukprot:2543694-Amphidinium_carterae.2
MFANPKVWDAIQRNSGWIASMLGAPYVDVQICSCSQGYAAAGAGGGYCVYCALTWPFGPDASPFCFAFHACVLRECKAISNSRLVPVLAQIDTSSAHYILLSSCSQSMSTWVMFTTLHR